MMGFAAFPQLVITGSGPVRLKDRTAGKLMKGLPEELGTSQAPVDPNGLAALLGDGCHSGQFLHLGSEFEAVAVRAESGQQTWRQRRAGSGETAKQR